MTAILKQVRRHPIGGHGGEERGEVMCAADRTLRRGPEWAVEHPAGTSWAPCASVARGARAPAPMRIVVQCTAAAETVPVPHPPRSGIGFAPDRVTVGDRVNRL